MGHAFTYKRNAERPAAKLWLFDDDGTLINLATHSFNFKIGVVGSAALLTKTTNITGAAGSGVEPTGTPNVTITWAAGELDIAPGVYTWELVATSSSLDRTFYGTFTVLDIIS